ncbi:lectin-like domain-containing protein [Streptomyces spectabilis]|uniref:DUF11 domain-containing protein n=1 Tax=Streptomyces spectabilis TaxID=68270 RepID=A0A5P2X748_STRST|nr:DUF11 domain-containing protein [Streptomyces spectabilis]MBB5101509.1 putative repeat protein (TIGR01451 family) [Streptomyces spectabilis]MCI3900699.1 DUF11 domain-containing protein [Streptomyces spectabilis]QEV58242.1 DUF11 domain-containing protein [Streptomyces spectabilis]GGV11855.1 hypothetical protein GCM10010245_21940 [Streptomyces spectabilis]
MTTSRHPAGPRRLAALLLALGALLCGALAPAAASLARAELAFPVHESFDNGNDLGTATGSATYQNGWLRLTPAQTSKAGSWQMKDSFPTSLGIVAEFTYATYGGTAFDGKRGDGMAFFLADGSAATGTGALGGALGYACSGTASRCTSNGVPGAFLGVGIDEFGNFSASMTGASGPGTQANKIVLRGGGNGTSGYKYGTAASGPGSTVETGSRANFRTVRVTVQPQGGKLLVSVWSDSGPGTDFTKVISDFDVSTVTGQPALPSTLRVGFSAGTGGATNNHEIGDLKINVPTDLSIATSGKPATAAAGSRPLTYTVTVTNSDANAVTGAAVKDAAPGLTDVTWTCSASSGSACGKASGTGPLDTTADLARSGTVTYTVTGTAPAQPTTLTNTATVIAPGDRTDTDPADNTATASTTVTARADASIVKEGVGKGPVRPGEEFEYRITVRDNGPSDTTDVKVTDTLPTGLTFVSSADGCTASGQTVTCPTRGRLAASASVSWTFRVKLDAAYQGDGSDLGNVAKVTHGVTDPNTANNTSTEATPPGGVRAPAADLATVKKTTTTAQIAPGEEYAYTVTVTNKGPSVARAVKVTDPLPTSLAFVSSADACTLSGRTVSCGPVATLAPGASVSWTFRVRLNADYSGDGTDVLNVATADADTADPDTGNNSGSATVPGGKVKPPTADLEFGKTAENTPA